MTEKKIVRKRLTLYGDVQGVGFRYRAYHAAASLRVTGWVRNEWDGSVQMEVQGTEEEIRQMLRLTEEGRFIRIDRVETELLDADEEERGFHIR